ncbi:DJ-1/PfpI family protein [Xenorhabdus bovienii]|uniref:DJ-1/PfpI family protein n=1 Tax=Xenorhabdus bovienii TaxID=40576 RepID=UPI00237D3052|nr:DJ-1/PfpI family protein [Xenorhabdus bovienii]MDE1482963.1 DJ-1/PfpI family protein [Xenorhabdus bovienii]MDE9433728.1 DJ-1/PfpI family protein [Xenorhabdus bovienii]MDE9443077.1 DJ-1/PfpI family protein [Xenorhabdus bovienii]MDE9491354.1 DJ-1/PfpI family protein [Xenorhabdus bovienii]MDE9507705.1 DJ-1/PfpI family protein [Xenorhabdus bovienii]
MLDKFKLVIITGPGFQDHDLVYTYYRSIEEGYDVSIATKDGESVIGKYGISVPMDKRAKPNITFDDLNEEKFDLVILTGGHEAPDRVRQDQRVKDFVSNMSKQEKVVAGLCHGPWIMISAGVMKGKLACAYVGLKDDMVNSGANVIEADVVVDKNIITCSYYSECGKFMKETFAAVKRWNKGEKLTEPLVV